MSTLRALLGIIGGCSLGYAIAALIPFTHMTATDFGVATAISSACVIGIFLIHALQKDRERIRRGRSVVWGRRDQLLADSLVEDFAGTWEEKEGHR